MDILWIIVTMLALVGLSWLGWSLSPSRRHPPQTTQQRLNEADSVNRITRHFL